jgi:hypothetical protein
MGRQMASRFAAIVAALALAAGCSAPPPPPATPTLAATPVPTSRPAPTAPAVQELPFRTLARDTDVSMVEKPTLDQLLDNGDFLVLTQPVDTLPPEPGHPEVQLLFRSSEGGAQVLSQLHSVDYSREFVVIVFWRSGGINSEYNTTDVREVARAGSQVVLQAHFGSTPPGIPSLPAISYPNQVVAVSKEGQWGQDIRFVLEVDGKVVKERAYFVP